LQILEDSGKYWLHQYCRYWKISYEVAECTCILFFLSGISGIEVSVSCHKKILYGCSLTQSSVCTLKLCSSGTI
jgi:hypothetical protein